MLEAAPPVVVPRLRTARLLLREFRQSDFEAYAAHAADPVVAEFTAGVKDRRTAWRMFAAGTGNWMLQGVGWWALEPRDMPDARDAPDAPRFVGTVGVFHRDGYEDLEIGWSLLRSFWRRGLASEAAAAALAYGRDVAGAKRVIAHISGANAASAGVARTIGMRYDREVDFYDGPIGRWIID